MPRVPVLVNIPEGYELACEEIYLQEIQVTPATDNRTHVVGMPSYLILRPAWQWPPWLTAPWIAMDKGGSWYAYEAEPKKEGISCWHGDRDFALLSSHMFAFTPPPCTDWRLSKRKNPNLKETT